MIINLNQGGRFSTIGLVGKSAYRVKSGRAWYLVELERNAINSWIAVSELKEPQYMGLQINLLFSAAFKSGVNVSISSRKEFDALLAVGNLLWNMPRDQRLILDQIWIRR